MPNGTAEQKRRAYGRKVAKVLRDMRRQERGAVRQATRILGDTRRRIVEQIRTARGGFSQFSAEETRRAIDASIREFEDRYGTLVRNQNAEAFERGRNVVREPVEIAVEARLALPELPADLIEVLQGTTADLVMEIGDEMRLQVNGQVEQIVTGTTRPQEAIANIENMFRSGKSDLRGFRRRTGFGWQAERIVRTETNRVFSVANQASVQQLKEELPDIKKQWENTGDGRERIDHKTPPPGGVAGEIKNTNETFSNGLMYPLDPRGRPEDVVN